MGCLVPAKFDRRAMTYLTSFFEVYLSRDLAEHLSDAEMDGRTRVSILSR
jgi:hypothetical protein